MSTVLRTTRLLSFLLVLIFVTGLVAGCGKKRLSYTPLQIANLRKQIVNNKDLTPTQRIKAIAALTAPPPNPFIPFLWAAVCISPPFALTYTKARQKKAAEELEAQRRRRMIARRMQTPVGPPPPPPDPYVVAQKRTEAIPNPQRGASFFTSCPMDIDDLVEVTIMVNYQVHVVYATSAEAAAVRAGNTPLVRAFTVGDLRLPWYEWKGYDPYVNYWKAAQSEWFWRDSGIRASWMDIESVDPSLAAYFDHAPSQTIDWDELIKPRPKKRRWAGNDLHLLKCRKVVDNPAFRRSRAGNRKRGHKEADETTTEPSLKLRKRGKRNARKPKAIPAQPLQIKLPQGSKRTRANKSANPVAEALPVQSVEKRVKPTSSPKRMSTAAKPASAVPEVVPETAVDDVKPVAEATVQKAQETVEKSGEGEVRGQSTTAQASGSEIQALAAERPGHPSLNDDVSAPSQKAASTPTITEPVPVAGEAINRVTTPAPTVNESTKSSESIEPSISKSALERNDPDHSDLPQPSLGSDSTAALRQLLDNSNRPRTIPRRATKSPRNPSSILQALSDDQAEASSQTLIDRDDAPDLHITFDEATLPAPVTPAGYVVVRHEMAAETYRSLSRRSRKRVEPEAGKHIASHVSSPTARAHSAFARKTSPRLAEPNLPKQRPVPPQPFGPFKPTQRVDSPRRFEFANPPRSKSPANAVPVKNTSKADSETRLQPRYAKDYATRHISLDFTRITAAHHRRKSATALEAAEYRRRIAPKATWLLNGKSLAKYAGSSSTLKKSRGD